MTPGTMDITLQEAGSGGRYVWRGGPDMPEAEMTFSRAGSLRIIDHTGVPDAYKGQGIGLVLVTRAVEDARAEGSKILPLCPFAAAMFRKHPDWSDVLADQARPKG